MVNILLYRTLLTFNLNFFIYRNNEVVSIDTFQHSAHLMSVRIKHLDAASYMVFILLAQSLPQAHSLLRHD